MAVQERPLVSIGLPVYNGEAYLSQALDSLLAQTYANFELNISDNASTDRTREICREYATKDRRIRYHRNPENIGFCGNWQRALRLATGPFFMWAADDDLWSENYLDVLTDCLVSRPNAILAAGRTFYIDWKGDICDYLPDDAPKLEPEGNLETAKQLLCQHATGWLHGLYRRKDLMRVAGSFFKADPWGADIVFLLDLCLSREVVGSNEALMYKRVMAQSGPKTPRSRVRWQRWFAGALMQVILKKSRSLDDTMELLLAYVLYLKWMYFKKGVREWALLWTRAGYQWMRGEDHP